MWGRRADQDAQAHTQHCSVEMKEERPLRPDGGNKKEESGTKALLPDSALVPVRVGWLHLCLCVIADEKTQIRKPN